MSYKIQVTVDAKLDRAIKRQAKELGLSVSSYARLALRRSIPQKGKNLLDQAIEDLLANRVDSVSFAEFKKQLHD